MSTAVDNIPFLDTLGNMKTHAIKQYRQKTGMTLETFGAMIGVNKGSVHKWEIGLNTPSPLHCLTIEQATGGAIRKSTLRPDIWGKS